jgi:ERF superfamily protein
MAAKNKTATETAPLLATMEAEPVPDSVGQYVSDQALATREGTPLTVEELMARAIEKGDTETMEKLYSMRREMKEESAREAFNAAMNRTQTEMRQISADASNPQTHSRYATYSALDKVIRPIYTRNGFALNFNTGEPTEPDTLLVLCEVSHDEGFSKHFKVPIPIVTTGPRGGDVMTRTHAAGSAMSYGKRYLLVMIFNIAIGDDDDDGNGAGFVPMTPGQLVDLETKITQTGANREKFLKYFGVESLEAMPTQRFGEAMRTLIEIEGRRKREEAKVK